MSEENKDIDDIYTEKEQAKELERQRRNKKRRITVYIYRALIVIAVVAIAGFAAVKVNESKKEEKIKAEQVAKEKAEKEKAEKEAVEAEAAAQAEAEAQAQAEAEAELDLSTLPADVVEALEFNPELEEFARGYATKKDMTFDVDLSAEAASGEIPLLLQWDERWGYKEYAGEMFGLSGCGPTTLSMLCIYKFQDPSYTPEYIAQFSKDNGYVMDGKGSFWTLIGEGGQQLGLDVMELNPREEDIVWYLQQGNPIVCIMGPGEFTRTGHFIILTGYSDGMISIKDSASVEKSERLWTYEEIGSQIQNAWVIQ